MDLAVFLLVLENRHIIKTHLQILVYIYNVLTFILECHPKPRPVCLDMKLRLQNGKHFVTSNA